MTEFRRTRIRELDFSAERRNQEEFTRNFSNDASVHFPVVHPHLCSRRVLTMELLIGIPSTNTADLHRSGVDLEKFAHRAATMYLNMIFRDGFYHADPHPGNYVLLSETVVGVLDSGTVGRIDDHIREAFEDILIALSEQDSDDLCDILLRGGSAPVGISIATFRADVTEFLTNHAYQSIKEFDLGGALEELTGIIRSHHLVLPSGVSLLLKTLVMLEGAALQLSPSFNLLELLEPLQRQLIRDRLRPKHWVPRVRRTFRDLDRLLGKAPKDLTRLLDRLRSGRFEIELDHRHLQAAVNRLVAGILAAALFLGSALLWSHSILPMILGFSVPGAAGCVVGVAMGIIILRNISRDQG